MGQDDKNDQRDGQGLAQGEPLPQEGDQVQWNWGAGHPQGTVTETATSGEISIETKRGNTAKKNADEDDTALPTTRPGAGQQDVVKRGSEVQVIGTDTDQPKGAAGTSSSTAEGEGKGSKQANSSSGSNSRKRKEQASTPTKKSETKARAGEEDGRNSAKKVRTGKEDDIFGSDIEDENEDKGRKDKKDEDIVLEDADPAIDPDETEDEKDKPAGKASEGAKGKGQDNKKEDAATNTAGTSEKSEASVVRKAHGHSKSLGTNVYTPATSNSDGGEKKSNDTTSGAENRDGNGKEKVRSASASAASGQGGGNLDPTAAATKHEERDEDKPKRRSSINEILNQNDQTSQDTDKGPAVFPPRKTKEVAGEKIASGSGAEDHGRGTGET